MSPGRFHYQQAALLAHRRHPGAVVMLFDSPLDTAPPRRAPSPTATDRPSRTPRRRPTIRSITQLRRTRLQPLRVGGAGALMAWFRMMGIDSIEYHRATVLGRADDHAGQAVLYYG